MHRTGTAPKCHILTDVTDRFAVLSALNEPLLMCVQTSVDFILCIFQGTFDCNLKLSLNI